MTCPKCGRQGEPEKVGFTWWGGVVGPRLLSHVRCPRCSATFNGNTGQSNDMAIRLYLAVVTIAVLMAAFAYFVGF